MWVKGSLVINVTYQSAAYEPAKNSIISMNGDLTENYNPINDTLHGHLL